MTPTTTDDEGCGSCVYMPPGIVRGNRLHEKVGDMLQICKIYIF